MVRLRVQGYDEASNVRGEFNGLKSLIMRENGSAYYVHFFAHQFQLASVVVEKNHIEVALLFNIVSNVPNIVGVPVNASINFEIYILLKLLKHYKCSGLRTGECPNKEITLKRPGDRIGGHIIVH